ncbi:MAG: hypothetical protein IKP88_19265 [Lachnospiraceae bacterium]|nr:hypothetical protein [Lachnospiraceae bacterium]
MKVAGFQFDDSMEYALAKKESDIINYIVERMNISDPQVALKVYYKLLDRNDFKTVVGLTFLKQLRDFCVQSGVVDENQIKFIAVLSDTNKKGRLSSFGDETSLEIDSAISESASDMNVKFERLDKNIDDEFAETEKALKRDIQNHINNEKKFKNVAEYYRGKVKKCYYAIAILAIVIIVLFIMALTGGNLPFSDTEKTIQDKYASWAEELSEREEALKVKESELVNRGEE